MRNMTMKWAEKKIWYNKVKTVWDSFSIQKSQVTVRLSESILFHLCFKNKCITTKALESLAINNEFESKITPLPKMKWYLFSTKSTSNVIHAILTNWYLSV